MQIVSLVLMILLSLIPGMIAQSKGYKLWKWWLYSFGVMIGASLFAVFLNTSLMKNIAQYNELFYVQDAAVSMVSNGFNICAYLVVLTHSLVIKPKQ
jgi:hypothetical protein